MEFPYNGDTERILGVSAINAVETALIQGKTINQYVAELRQLGTYPELESPLERARIKREMRRALYEHVWHEWIIVYHDGKEFVETFNNPLRILDLLERDDGIKSILPLVTYEIMVDQLRDASGKDEDV